MSNRVDSPRAPEPVGLYPHARRVGNLLFLSGVGPRERGSKKIPGVELDAQGNLVVPQGSPPVIRGRPRPPRTPGLRRPPRPEQQGRPEWQESRLRRRR